VKGEAERPQDGISAQDVVREAERLGFLACGIATLEPSRRQDALDAWLKRGYAGTMRYLHRQARKRKEPAVIVAGAKVAVVVLENYLPPPAEAETGVKIAKYARGTDYHRVLRRRLGLLADWLRQHGAAIAHGWADDGPVPERELAQRAGLGWIGKNTMLIRPGAGSFFFIGAVFTDLSLEPSTPFASDHCGTCSRCLDACPTGAILEPRVLDATRCISYLTIESRAPIPEALVPQLEGWAFGCDICNDVCPWNERFAAQTAIPDYHDRREPDRADAGVFERMDEAEFARRFGDTPLERPGLQGMRRNWRAAWESIGRHR
jgi:epoxyqueuosine reductase